MTTAADDHNVAVVREVAQTIALGEEDVWVHGFVVGIALATIAPKTAQAVRQRVEGVVAEGQTYSAEQVEVYLRSIAQLFNRSLDS